LKTNRPNTFHDEEREGGGEEEEEEERGDDDDVDVDDDDDDDNNNNNHFSLHSSLICSVSFCVIIHTYTLSIIDWYNGPI
jgi:hypothetical protein